MSDKGFSTKVPRSGRVPREVVSPDNVLSRPEEHWQLVLGQHLQITVTGDELKIQRVHYFKGSA